MKKVLLENELEEISGGFPKRDPNKTSEPARDWDGDCTACGSAFVIQYFGLGQGECAVDPSMGIKMGDIVRIRGISNFRVTQFHNKGNFIFCGLWVQGFPEYYQTKYLIEEW